MTNNHEAVEVKSTLWQKIVAALLCLLISGISAMGMMQILFPTQFPNVSLQYANTLERLTTFSLLLFFVTGLFTWWSSLHYRLFADEKGILQSDGLRTIKVRWSEVGSYQWRVRRGTSDRYVEAVLLDHEGKVVFQPFAHMLISDQSILRRRKEFWQFVTAHCPKHSEPTQIGSFSLIACGRRGGLARRRCRRGNG